LLLYTADPETETKSLDFKKLASEVAYKIWKYSKKETFSEQYKMQLV